MKNRAALSAVIIAANEGRRIARCLERLEFCDERVVVVSENSDPTARIASDAGARVFIRPFDNFASQKNYAISKAKSDWVLLLDADELLDEGAGQEIRFCINEGRFDAFYFHRQNWIFGRPMRFGPHRNDLQLRLVRKDAAVFEGLVHERIYCKKDTTGVLRSVIVHESTPTISDYLKKLNLYSDLEAKILENRQEEGSVQKMKYRPLGVLARQVILQGSWLDGIRGFFFTVLSAYYEFVKRAKRWEISRKSPDGGEGRGGR